MSVEATFSEDCGYWPRARLMPFGEPDWGRRRLLGSLRRDDAQQRSSMGRRQGTWVGYREGKSWLKQDESLEGIILRYSPFRLMES